MQKRRNKIDRAKRGDRICASIPLEIRGIRKQRSSVAMPLEGYRAWLSPDLWRFPSPHMLRLIPKRRLRKRRRMRRDGSTTRLPKSHHDCQRHRRRRYPRLATIGHQPQEAGEYRRRLDRCRRHRQFPGQEHRRLAGPHYRRPAQPRLRRGRESLHPRRRA